MFQFILNQSASESALAVAFDALRRVIVRYVDPVVYYEINGRRVAINLAHQFPIYRRQQPAFCRNFTRLCQFMRAEFGALRMIDVGANVGDSYCLADPHPSDSYLLIEGDARYFSLLERNTQHDPTVRRMRALVSDGSETTGHLVAERGNARVTGNTRLPHTQIAGGPWMTLEEILNGDSVFLTPHLLKTDVEGYDTRVIMGARAHIGRTSPVLFFEHYPRLLRQAGDSDMAIFAELARLGYSHAVLYDHLGFLVATAETSDAALIGDLVANASQRDVYYDVCCLPDAYADARARFIDAERQVAIGVPAAGA